MSIINLQCIHANSCIRLKAMHDTQSDTPLEIVCNECAYFLDVNRPANVVEFGIALDFAYDMRKFCAAMEEDINSCEKAPSMRCLTIGQVLEELSEKVQLPSR